MNFKIDTKEKMHVITVEEPELAANMTVELEKKLSSYLSEPVKNLVINLEKVKRIDENIAGALVTIQQSFYDNSHSLVFCKLQPEVESYLESIELLEVMNVTRTESEAWDIVQMEEIEREYL
ncbi:MAG: STAS domain-containing protein [Ginsengibacter sp.]